MESLACVKQYRPHAEQRQFIRHPSDIGIEVWQDTECECKHTSQLNNVSQGGIAFHSKQAYPKGCDICVRILLPCEPFTVHGRVCWCRQTEERDYEMGVAFCSQQEAFHARMIEQVCWIEQYRRQQQQCGRQLNSDQAAEEWVTEYASQFPELPCVKGHA